MLKLKLKLLIGGFSAIWNWLSGRGRSNVTSTCPKVDARHSKNLSISVGDRVRRTDNKSGSGTVAERWDTQAQEGIRLCTVFSVKWDNQHDDEMLDEASLSRIVEDDPTPVPFGE